ncbi:LysR family transcriptional regulator [Tropicimonas sp. S265A]|uniref:LysR family transcriptional regulator n=1 Tax=Tropicimonas sp. S265A TaxID=3415134 RepID=UPI003C7A6374
MTLLTCFARVAELGSLSAAGRDLGVSQPTVTRQIDTLEAMLGTKLLHRSPHAVTLTPAGEVALADARKLLAEWDAFADRNGEAGEISGGLRVIVPVALGQTVLAKAAAAFQSLHPLVTLDWRLSDADINLVAEGADCWIKVGPVRDDRLIVRSLAKIARRAVLAPAADATRMIALGGFEAVSPVLKNSAGQTYSPEARVVFRTNNFMAAYQQVRAGAGFAVLPDWFVRSDLASGHLADLAPGFAAQPMPLSVAFLPGARPKRLDAFLYHMEEAAQHVT